MTDINAVAKAFVEYYYQTFDSNRAGLNGLYREDSMLTFEGQQCKGVSSIMEKLTNPSFQKTAHQITSLDAQPSSPSNNIVVTVTGILSVDDNANPLMFCQTFQLIAEGGTYWVLNDIFRLNFA